MLIVINKALNGYQMSIDGDQYAFEDTREQDAAYNLGVKVTEVLNEQNKPKPIVVQSTSGVEIREPVVKSTFKFKVGQQWQDGWGQYWTIVSIDTGSITYPIKAELLYCEEVSQDYTKTGRAYASSQYHEMGDLVTLVKDVD